MARTVNKKAQSATRKNGVNKDKLQSVKPNKSKLQSIKPNKSNLQSIKSTKKQTKVGAAASKVKDELDIGNGYLKAVSQTNKAKKADKLVPLKTYKPKKSKKK